MSKLATTLAGRASIAGAATTLSLSLCLAVPAKAVVFFSDNFNSNVTGLNAIPNTWTIDNNGGVDLIGNGFYDLGQEFASYGVYVDLDGTANSAGLLTHPISLIADQTYTLQFALAGNHRNANTDNVTVQFGTAARQININPSAPFATYSLLFTPTSTGQYSFSFLDAGGDMQGATLDNVIVFTGQPPNVPTPLSLLGIGVAWNIRRRLRRGQRTRLG